MRVSGFNSGQYGDLVMNTVAAKRLKELFPSVRLSLGIANKYSAVAPLFFNHPHIDGVHIWEGYDNFPTEKDKLLFDKFDRVFHPMPQHTNGDSQWFTKRHQTSEVCLMNGLGEYPASQCFLEKWFYVPNLGSSIAFAPFAGWYNKNNDKKLSEERANQICRMIVSMGYEVYQIGGADEPRLGSATFLESSIFESVKNVLGCKMLLHTDTFIGWAASAYGHRQVGLYSDRHYLVGGENFVKNIIPINSKMIPIIATNVNDILDDQIESAIKHCLL